MSKLTLEQLIAVLNCLNREAEIKKVSETTIICQTNPSILRLPKGYIFEQKTSQLTELSSQRKYIVKNPEHKRWGI